jgi:hypothetical protein
MLGSRALLEKCPGNIARTKNEQYAYEVMKNKNEKLFEHDLTV